MNEPVPFLDLRETYLEIKDELDTAIVWPAMGLDVIHTGEGCAVAPIYRACDATH